jgi:hypothetical protein
MIQTEAPATAKQLWFLHLLTKQNTREWVMTMKEASDMITVLKAKKIEAKQRIEIPASAPVKVLNAGPDPDVIIGEYTEIVNTESLEIVAPYNTDNISMTLKGNLEQGLARLPGGADRQLVKYRANNIQYAYRNFIGVYIDNTWRNWIIDYAHKLRDPNYMREVESQGIEIRQLCEIN